MFTLNKDQKCDSSGISPLKKVWPKGKGKITEQPRRTAQRSMIWAQVVPDMPTISTRQKGIRKLLLRLNLHKAKGPDELPTRLLKEMVNEIIPALVFQASLQQGKTPTDWSIFVATVTLIFKKGDKRKPSNYRPVALTSVCCKVLEHVTEYAQLHHAVFWSTQHSVWYAAWILQTTILWITTNSHHPKPGERARR